MDPDRSSSSRRASSPLPGDRRGKRARLGLPRSDPVDIKVLSLIKYDDSVLWAAADHALDDDDDGRDLNRLVPAAGMMESGILNRQPLTIGGVELAVAGLAIPEDVSDDDFMRRYDAMALEMRRQAAHLPLLPPSQVVDLPPKPDPPVYHAVTEGMPTRERRRLEALNNALSAHEKALDKARNNLAAKKSRQTRIEALHNTRQLLNEKTAECAWLRLKVIVLGGALGDWDRVPEEVKRAMAADVDARVHEAMAGAAEAKKKEERRRRTEQSRRRKLARAAEDAEDAEDAEQPEAEADEE